MDIQQTHISAMLAERLGGDVESEPRHGRYEGKFWGSRHQTFRDLGRRFIELGVWSGVSSSAVEGCLHSERA